MQTLLEAASPATVKLKKDAKPVDVKALLDKALQSGLKTYRSGEGKDAKDAASLVQGFKGSPLFVQTMESFKNSIETAVKDIVDFGDTDTAMAMNELGAKIRSLKTDDWEAFVKALGEALASVQAVPAAESEETPVDEEEEDDPWVEQWFNAYERKSAEGPIDHFDEAEVDGEPVPATFGANAVDMFPDPGNPPEGHHFGQDNAAEGGAALDTAAEPAVAEAGLEHSEPPAYSVEDPITGELAANGGTAEERWIRAKMAVLKQKGLFRD